MSSGRAQDTGRTVGAPDVLPPTSPTPLRSYAAILADELSRSADNIKWPRMPELREFEQTAGIIMSAGCYNFEELADARTAERAQMHKILFEGRAGRPRVFRKMLDTKSPLTEVEVKKSHPYKEVDVFAAFRANPALSGIGEPPRPLQEAVNLFS